MFRFDRWMLPEGETHLLDIMRRTNRHVDGRLVYQYHKYEAALRFVKQRRVAIDIGAHVGMWSWVMARDFEKLVAFEPVAAHADCWSANMADRKNAALYRIAMGDSDRHVTLRRDGESTGDTCIVTDGVGQAADQRQLDNFDFHNIDFIKIDCEGYELFVLRGAKETILRNKPVMIVEQKPHRRYDIDQTAGIDYLRKLGMKPLREPMSGDWIMGW